MCGVEYGNYTITSINVSTACPFFEIQFAEMYKYKATVYYVAHTSFTDTELFGSQGVTKTGITMA